MAKITDISGTITLDDGTTRQFTIGTDGGWQQWGVEPSRLGDTVDALEAMTQALLEDDHLATDGEDLDDDEDDEG